MLSYLPERKPQNLGANLLEDDDPLTSAPSVKGACLSSVGLAVQSLVESLVFFHALLP